MYHTAEATVLFEGTQRAVLTATSCPLPWQMPMHCPLLLSAHTHLPRLQGKAVGSQELFQGWVTLESDRIRIHSGDQDVSVLLTARHSNRHLSATQCAPHDQNPSSKPKLEAWCEVALQPAPGTHRVVSCWAARAWWTRPRQDWNIHRIQHRATWTEVKTSCPLLGLMALP